ncbi:DUF2752 domain-containing protein [Chitinophagaceae bacterium LWZ2-11]
MFLFRQSLIFGSTLLDWLDKHLIPCPVKKFLHIECPGCGIQRSILLLLKGKVVESFNMYPATIPIFLMLVYLVFHLRFKFQNGLKILLTSYSFCTLIVLINYICKIIN